MNNRDFLLYQGDCIAVMRTMATASVDSIVTDPPYELGFMGKGWDSTGIANSVEMWTEALRVLKPGGHLLAFSGSRTYHRMVCAIEDAGFDIRDQIMWVYGSGFPKSLDVSKAIDKAAGAVREVLSTGAAVKRMIPGADQDKTGSWVKDNGREYVPTVTAAATDAAQQWQGWGTALKPAHEPICVARKPLIGTVAANVLTHGVGALNIDGCRVETSDNLNGGAYSGGDKDMADATSFATGVNAGVFAQPVGRWPANLIHDGSDEVLAEFPDLGNAGKHIGHRRDATADMGGYSGAWLKDVRDTGYADAGSAARFFYTAKADGEDRNEGIQGSAKAHGRNLHPTVKPTDLMRYLCRLVTPPGGLVLDPFMGSGSTGKAAVIEGFCFVGIDLSPEYVAIARARIAAAVRMGYQLSLNLEAA